MIPKIIHYYWDEGSVPPEHQSYIDSWITCNPDFEIRSFNKKDLKKLSQFDQNLLSACKYPCEESDLARFWILHDYGGVYLDTDIEIFKSINPLLKDRSFAVGCSKDYCFQGGLLMSSPQSPQIIKLCNGLKDRSLTHSNASAEYKFGPQYIMDCFEFKEVDKIYDFFPYSYDDRFLYTSQNILKAFPKLIGVHHYHHTWGSKSINSYMIVDKSNSTSKFNYDYSNQSFYGKLNCFDAIMTQKHQSDEQIDINLSKNLPNNWINFENDWIRNKYILGCSASYVSLFHSIHTNKLPTADWYLIMEDDVTINIKYPYLMNELNKMTQRLPKDVDLINLCPLNSIIAHKQFQKKHHIYENFYKKRNRAAFGSQVILYKHSFIKKFLQSLPLRNEIDIHYMLEMNNGKFKYWAHKNNWFNHFGEDHLDSVRGLYANKFNEHFPDELCISNKSKLPSRRSSQLD